MDKKNSFIKTIQLWGIIFLFVIGGSFVAFDVFRSYRDFDRRADLMRAEYTAMQKDTIKNEVERVVDLIDFSRTQCKSMTSKNIAADKSAEEIEEQIKASVLLEISRIRFGKEGYIFINRFNGDALVSNGKLLSGNKKLWEEFDADPEEMKDIFRMELAAARKPAGDYIYYSHLKLTDTSKASPKASFIYGIPEWKWLVGAGVYLDDVERDIALMHAELDKQIKAKVLFYTLIAAGIILIFLLIFGKLSSRLKKDFGLFISFFNSAAHSDEPIDRTKIKFDELDRMAIDANMMVEDHKRAKETFQKIEKLESVGTLAGGIAHDFNNILTGLFGNISFTKEMLPTSHPGYKSLDAAEKSMSRAIRLTKQLLTFSRGGAPLTENVSLDKLVTEVVRFDLSGSNVKPVFDKAEDLWPAQADKGQIQQVFSNLTVNARQAMPEGGHLRVSMQNAEIGENEMPDLDAGKYVRIKIADEGCGMAREQLSRIFEPYYTTKEGGSGLGLATAHSIVRQHGGSIGVESQPGKGTTFTLYLPAADSFPAPGSVRPEADRAAPMRNARVLVMDDEEMIRKVAAKILETRGYRVESAHDGGQAVRMYLKAMQADEPFDVVIMDLTIPGGVGGKQAIKNILEIDPEAKVIVSSGYANDPIMANYADYGFCDVVAKPYTKAKLLDALDQVLEG